MQHLWAKLNKQQGYIPPHGAEGLPPFYRCVSATVMESQLLRWELHSLPQSYLGRRPSELQMLSLPLSLGFCSERGHGRFSLQYSVDNRQSALQMFSDSSESHGHRVGRFSSHMPHFLQEAFPAIRERSFHCGRVYKRQGDGQQVMGL